MMIGDSLMETTNLAPVMIKSVCLDADRRVLLCRNDRQEWELPGGRPELGESFPACLIREIGEETGISVTVQELIAAYPYEALPGGWINVIVYACAITDCAEPVASHEHDRVAFMNPGTLAAEQVPDGYHRAIESRLKLG
jgi:8-oxo-dGTP pyrophosphatase MutT (NUDIX family)